MAILLECENGHKLRVNDALAGKKVRCPKCQTVVPVEGSGESFAEETAKPQTGQRSPKKDARNRVDESLPSVSNSPQRATRSSKAQSKRTQTRGSGGKKAIIAAAIAIVFVGAGIGIALTKRSTARPETVENSVAASTSAVIEDKQEQPAGGPNAADSNRKERQTTKVTNVAMAGASPAAAIPSPLRDSLNLKSQNGGVSTNRNAPVRAIATPAGISVWDVASLGSQKAGLQNPASRSEGWIPLAPETAPSYVFHGDCLIENDVVQLRLPRDSSAEAVLVAKTGIGERAAVPIAIVGREGKSGGSRTFHVSQLSGESAVVEFGEEGSGGPRVACRLDKGRYWIEVKPLAKAEQLAIDVKSQFVVVPTEFGEDLICDALLCQPGQRIALPRENLVIALECDGNFMSVLTYPSSDQADAAIIGGEPGVQNHGAALAACVSSLSAKFNGKSVFVGVLPQQDNWYFQAVNKKYSASGQYAIPWKPPHPGVWRLGGRVKERYFMGDVADDHFIFACSQSGTLDCVFAYLSHASAGAAPGIVTPLSIYQEALAGSKGSAYLIETESRDSAQKLDRRKTRYRDVCNSVDDMRDTWRNKSNTLDAEPDYVPGLLADCKAIIERMDGRLHAFGELGRQVGDAAAQLKQQEKDAQSASSRTFLAALQRADAKLKITKIVPIARALATAGKLEEKVARHKEVRLNVKELDAMAESMRDVANHQERQLKKLRDAALQLAEVCAKQRKAAPDRLKPLVTSIGRDCRKVLRNRDPEE